ncbi:hypothetical protein BN1088_1430825 [Sphingobacterium sp. PM2-P1-29]|nr:hypothetical protein BN1088_1430825 [Sphingobacterium sp. PM2-P1-29]
MKSKILYHVHLGYAQKNGVFHLGYYRPLRSVLLCCGQELRALPIAAL